MIRHVWQGWTELITTMCFHSADNIIHRLGRRITHVVTVPTPPGRS
jgi:hypothetical protein